MVSSTQTATCSCNQNVSEEELFRRLDECIEDYHTKPGGLIPALQIAQGIFGYLPESVLKRISIGFDKSYSEVAGVVSFYSFFSIHPRGKHMIRVCMGTACYVRGGKQILEAMKKELGIDVGETTKDGLFSLEIARCFGACGLAPVITIDDEVYQRVKESNLSTILETYRTAEEPVMENAI